MKNHRKNAKVLQHTAVVAQDTPLTKSDSGAAE